MKRINWLAAAVSALLLAGCSLARPEAEGAAADPFVGFYVVREEGDGFFDNPNLTEYGSSAVDLEGFGRFDLPREVLFAEQKGREYVFPGLENGYSLFVLHREEPHGAVTEVVSNMAPHKDGMAVRYTDDGHSETLSGTIYYGPPLGEEDWEEYDAQETWHAYRVYQAPDGRPYLDGSGNRFTGGGLGAYTETRTNTITENGEAVESSLSVTVSGEAVPRLERLVVTQFDAKNQIVYSGDLSRDELPEIHCAPETAWVLVEEHSGEGVVRTVYNAPDGEPISHPVVLLDGGGLGRLEYLQIV